MRHVRHLCISSTLGDCDGLYPQARRLTPDTPFLDQRPRPKSTVRDMPPLNIPCFDRATILFLGHTRCNTTYESLRLCGGWLSALCTAGYLVRYLVYAVSGPWTSLVRRRRNVFRASVLSREGGLRHDLLKLRRKSCGLLQMHMDDVREIISSFGDTLLMSTTVAVDEQQKWIPCPKSLYNTSSEIYGN